MCAVSGGGALAVALLSRRGLRWLLRWRAPQLGDSDRFAQYQGGLCRHPHRTMGAYRRIMRDAS